MRENLIEHIVISQSIDSLELNINGPGDPPLVQSGTPLYTSLFSLGTKNMWHVEILKQLDIKMRPHQNLTPTERK